MNLETAISARLSGEYARALPPHVYPKGRKGYLYFFKRYVCARIVADIGSPEFEEEYAALVALHCKPKGKKAPAKRAQPSALSPREIPLANVLHELLRHDPDGSLYWKERPAASFAESDRFSQESLANMWNARCAGKRADRPTGDGRYRVVGMIGGRYLAHRVIWAMTYGSDPQVIDHINGDGHDNRLGNLRSVDPAENGKNRAIGKNNASGHMGVTRHKDRWKAQISGRFLGLFATIEEAIAARKEGERQLGFHENSGRKPKAFPASPHGCPAPMQA